MSGKYTFSISKLGVGGFPNKVFVIPKCKKQ